MSLNAGEWVRLEQALSEATVNHEHFPECMRGQIDDETRSNIRNWDTLSIEKRVGIAAVHMFRCGVMMPGPAAIIHRAYIKLCTGR